ncbi:MAG: hypothetical protein HeimAB125_18000 [Candidatus Heimdallarchaeota archaeon AB_125]|nr:MAG: hypothetical protein HeimAB125_18000 [Candidatus Heimdallarchaeota archaeon AB_125]
MEESKRETITYQCNQCHQKRILLLPAAMDIKVDSRGLSEYVDLHTCKNSEIIANVLFIDPQLAVRSQVHVSSEFLLRNSHRN